MMAYDAVAARTCAAHEMIGQALARARLLAVRCTSFIIMCSQHSRWWTPLAHVFASHQSRAPRPMMDSRLPGSATRPLSIRHTIDDMMWNWAFMTCHGETVRLTATYYLPRGPGDHAHPNTEDDDDNHACSRFYWNTAQYLGNTVCIYTQYTRNGLTEKINEQINKHARIGE